MDGNVEWAALTFGCTVAMASFGIAWRARGLLSDQQSRHDASIASLSNAIQDRNFLLKFELAIADLTKDVRHAKANLEHYATIFGELHDEVIRLGAEVGRLGKIVNGKGDKYP